MVRFTRSKTCEHCGACMHFGDTQAQVELKNTLGAGVGDTVTVELHAKSFLQASMLVYVFPLIALLLGVALGSRISEVWGIVLGLAGVGAVFVVLRLLEPRFQRKGKYNPRMVGIVTNENKAGGNQ